MSVLPVPVEQPSLVWQAADIASEFRQSEIVTTATRYDYASESGEVAALEVPIAIVLTQDCDLLGDFERRSGGGEGELDHILMMAGYTVAWVKEATKFGSKEMKPVLQNLSPRWHYLEVCPAECDAQGSGLEAFVIDFRSIFAMPIAELYYQCSVPTAQRRAVLAAPYREHFQARAASFMSRIVLPQPHVF